MGESLFGKLRDVLSREKTSDIVTPVSVTGSPANLARIGLATRSPAGTELPGGNLPAPGMPTDPLQQAAPSSGVAPVDIQFFAEVPSQQCAEEIVSISQGATNCQSAQAQPISDTVWTVAVTLCMAPVPQEIHAIETVFQTWAQKLGGASKGWGLSQNQAA
ncbi:ribonuclease E inhibitor RraB [Anderseniella sp. Alg231-50]|uniref:ribonuclease E inhibitor RraB n=1 Tax=Anderseniella sp. Alg231-50 TaxID=1922226 RepID=UPI000D561C57